LPVPPFCWVSSWACGLATEGKRGQKCQRRSNHSESRRLSTPDLRRRNSSGTQNHTEWNNYFASLRECMPDIWLAADFHLGHHDIRVPRTMDRKNRDERFGSNLLSRAPIEQGRADGVISRIAAPAGPTVADRPRADPYKRVHAYGSLPWMNGR
jgi:hypothetical protein